MAPGFGSAELFRMIGSFALVLALMAVLLWAPVSYTHLTLPTILRV